MSDNQDLHIDAIRMVQREAAAAAIAVHRFLEAIGGVPPTGEGSGCAEPLSLPLDVVLGLAARLRLMQWEACGWNHLVPADHGPTADRVDSSCGTLRPAAQPTTRRLMMLSGLGPPG